MPVTLPVYGFPLLDYSFISFVLVTQCPLQLVVELFSFSPWYLVSHLSYLLRIEFKHLLLNFKFLLVYINCYSSSFKILKINLLIGIGRISWICRRGKHWTENEKKQTCLFMFSHELDQWYWPYDIILLIAQDLFDEIDADYF